VLLVIKQLAGKQNLQVVVSSQKRQLKPTSKLMWPQNASLKKKISQLLEVTSQRKAKERLQKK
jgi:hypothetical protein